MSMRLKKGDQVTVNTGKDKGKVGEVMKILGMKAIVKGCLLYTSPSPRD